MWPKQLHQIAFAERRKTFLKKIKGGIALFPSAHNVIRNNDVHFPYRQDSSFYYLTGFEEPECICLLSPDGEHPFHLFVHPKDKKKELWEGKLLGPDGAIKRLGADLAEPSIPETHFDEAFIAALAEAELLFYRIGHDPQFDQRVFSLMYRAQKRIGRTGRPLWPIFDPTDILGEMRLIKTKPELERLEIAANITAESHVNAMKIAKPGMFEYEVEAVLHHAFRVRGAKRQGYSSIVASGQNACTLHYVQNNRQMDEGDLLLVDAGAEFDYYTADITRVFPVGGTFSKEQREIYQAVLRSQSEAIRVARPGKSLSEVHNRAVEVLVDELKRLKILKGPSKRIIERKEYQVFYPHGTSHWLGMDVHDVGKYYNGTYDNYRKLVPGMVFTVEPGLYFSLDANCPARYKGIGVRIEDDILVTSQGAKILTSGVPKEIDEIESLCRRS